MNHALITDYYISHRDELLAFVSSRLGRSDFAEDIVQNVFLKLLTTDKMISEVTLPSLVYTIARNLIKTNRLLKHMDDAHPEKDDAPKDTPVEGAVPVKMRHRKRITKGDDEKKPE